MSLIFFKMRNISDIFIEEIKTHFLLCNVFLKSYPVWNNVEIYYLAGQATDDNMARAHYMPDT